YVRKESILDAAWPGVVVEESNLAVQISSIRRVLAQAPGGEHWVETLARRGYRFVGPVTELIDDRRQHARRRSKNTNLPEPLTSFIGRERELVEIKRLLPGKRSLTLVGVGGIGKTRLALQLAAEVIDAYRDGVWLVELGSIRDPSLVPTSVAQVLGVQERTGKPLTESLCAHLKARQLLLILDNCEHLLDACATLADAILHTAAESTIMATSREPMHVAGEQTYPLQTLSLPDPSAGNEAIGRSEAVQLFVERAQRQLPDFELTAARAPAVANLCIHLDGIPLALELAAARVRTLSVEQINARLHDRFRLLTSGSRTALPRQQTLRATLDWSFDLLGEQERAVLRRLAVFAGGFTLEAASSVTSDEAIDELAVMDLLSQLVVRSLVIADTNRTGARYRMLETTRAYALEKLTEAGETESIQRRHARYFRDRFKRASDEELSISQAEWRAIYLAELDNVRAALDWALGAGGDRAIGVALAGASAPVWTPLLPMEKGVPWLEAALAQVAKDTPVLDQARLWHWLCEVLGSSAPARAVEASERATDLYRRVGDASRLGLSLLQLGRRRVFMGRFADAELVFAEALPLLERTDLPRLLAGYFRELGALKMLTGDLAAARMHFEKALTLFRDAGAESAAIIMLLNLGDMAWALGDLDTAFARFREAIALIRKSAPLFGDILGHCLTNLAGVHTERGELAEALAAAREGLPLREEAGNAWTALDHSALRAALAGKMASAARVAGYVDSAFAANETPRQPNEARAHARLQVLLRAKLAPDELERL
ncbi:MAG TPA: tetratricopeptide repeat protein, partial [Polyangiaceae bacterium]|nr:tetratricopeptide repeat protein [Polyangiaceae bacterium]